MTEQKQRASPLNQSYSNARSRGLWQSWLALPARLRLQMSLAVCVFAIGGIYISKAIEEKMPAPPKNERKNDKDSFRH